MTFQDTKLSTRAAEILFNADGFVRVNVRPDIKQELKDAQENMKAVCKEYKIPLIVDLRKAKPVDPEIRRFYSGQVLNDHFLSMAILIDITVVGRMMANVYLSVAKPEIPTKVFTDDAEAVSWTKSFCNGKK